MILSIVLICVWMQYFQYSLAGCKIHVRKSLACVQVLKHVMLLQYRYYRIIWLEETFQIQVQSFTQHCQGP